MSKLLLLIQSDADVANLSVAAEAIIQRKPGLVWVITSPAVAVSIGEASAALDTEIADLRVRMQNASAREDFEAASGLKKALEGKQLDRAAAISTAHTKLSDAEKSAKLKAIFTPFGQAIQAAGISMEIRPSKEHFDTDNYWNLIAAFKDIWKAEMPHGEYELTWARALKITPAEQRYTDDKGFDTSSFAPTPQEFAESLKPYTAPEKPKADPNHIYSGAQLEGVPFFTLRGIAMKCGVWVEKQPKAETIRRILEAQSVAA